MELVSKEECHILKAHKLILQNWVKEKSFLLENVAAAEAIGRGSGGAPRECCDIDTYFRLAQALQSCTKEQSRKDWTAFHAHAFQFLPPSALDLCSVVFAHWLSPSQTRRTGSGSVRSTGMVSEIADALEIGAGVGVELMDACLTVLGTTFETSVSLIHARDVIDFVQIVASDVEEARDLYRFDSTSAAREGCPLSDCPQIFRDLLQRFEAGCMKRPRMKERLEKLKADIRKKGPTILLFPLIIGRSAVRRGNASMGHWVAIEYTLDYNRGRKSTCRSLRNVCVRVGDSLISRGESFGSLKEEHLFMIDALCAACTSFRPERIPKSNLTLDKSPEGCELPVQVRGNGCAAYTLATICRSNAHLRRPDLSSSSACATSHNLITPFSPSLFDGAGEKGARSVMIYLAMIRLYQYGSFVFWSRPCAGEVSLMVRYVEWERDQGKEYDVVELPEVCFKGSVPVSTVYGLHETAISPEAHQEQSIILSEEFLRKVAGGIRKFVPAFQTHIGPEPCTFYRSPRETRVARVAKRRNTGTTNLPMATYVRAVWNCTHATKVDPAVKNCKTKIKILQYPKSDNLEVELWLRPGRTVVLHSTPQNGSLPISEVLR